MSGSTGLDNLYVVDGVNITNTGYGAVGSYSIVFGSLGTGTPFDFVQEVQVKTGGYEAEFGQSMGGVVNVVTKSGTNDLRGSVFGYFQPAELEAGYKTYESPNGTVNTVGQGRTDTGIEGGFPIIRNKLFFFGAINPAWEKRTFTAPEGFPLRGLGEIDRDRLVTSYSAKGTYQASSSHRFDASFFGDPATGDMGPQRTSALTVTDTSSFSEIEYGGHNQTVRYDGVLSPTWLLEGSFARAYNLIGETPSVDEWRVTDTTVVPNVITGGIGGYEQGNKGTNMQYAVKTTVIAGGHQIKGGFLYEDVEYSQVNQRTGPTFTAPDGQQTATGASVNIVADPTFGRIWRVIRANFNPARVTTQNYWSFFVQDTWRVGERLTINPGLRYEEQTLVGTIQELTTLQGNTISEFALKGNWAPRIGAVYDVLGNGRSRLYGNYGRFFARIPNDLAARALSSDAGFTRGDYFDANLTQPIPNGVLAGGQTNHYLLAGVGADAIDEEAKLSYKDEIVAGFEYRGVAEHQPRGALHLPQHRPRARGRGGRASGGLRPRPAGPEQRRVHPHEPGHELPDPLPRAGGKLRGSRAQLQRPRVHGRPPFQQQLVDDGQLPLVAAARLVRGLLPRGQRPVGPRHHLPLRLPDQRPVLHGDRRHAVRLPGRHPLPRRARRRPAAARPAAPVQDRR